MEEKINNPHDKYFRSVLSNKEIAKDFVKAFLPSEISESIDFEHFEQVTDSFIDEQLKTAISDIIYKTKFKETEQDIFVSLLFEHKSYYQEDTIFQLHGYIGNIWAQHIKQEQPRPLIIPMVIYHGKERWKKKEMVDFFLLPNEYFKRFLPIFDYILVDLSDYSEEEILAMHINAMVQPL